MNIWDEWIEEWIQSSLVPELRWELILFLTVENKVLFMLFECFIFYDCRYLLCTSLRVWKSWMQTGWKAIPWRTCPGTGSSVLSSEWQSGQRSHWGTGTEWVTHLSQVCNNDCCSYFAWICNMLSSVHSSPYSAERRISYIKRPRPSCLHETYGWEWTERKLKKERKKPELGDLVNKGPQQLLWVVSVLWLPPQLLISFLSQCTEKVDRSVSLTWWNQCYQLFARQKFTSLISLFLPFLFFFSFTLFFFLFFVISQFL